MKLSEMKLAKSMGAAILDMYKMRRKTRIENYCRLFNHFSLKSIFKIIKVLYYVGINICTKS